MLLRPALWNTRLELLTLSKRMLVFDKVLAIELVAACQAMEFHRPKTTTPILEKIYALVREKIAPFNVDRFMAPDLEEAWRLLRSGKLWNAVAPELGEDLVQNDVYEGFLTS
jgi:histidine ammonia-lyase